MNLAEARRLIDQVKLEDHPAWWYVVRNFDGSAFHGQPFYLQIRMLEEDHDSPGEIVEFGGRKWALSSHMTESEVIQTALRAYLDAIEHEGRESFRYRGRALFGPHISVRAHHRVAGELERRSPTGRGPLLPCFRPIEVMAEAQADGDPGEAPQPFPPAV